MKKFIVWQMMIIMTAMLFPAFLFASKAPDDPQKSKILSKAYRMQIPFIENKGQMGSEDIRFYANTFGGTLFVGKDGTLTYSLPFGDRGGVVIKEIFTDKKIEVTGLESSPTKINYFVGEDQSKWRTNIPNYSSVSLGEVYKGVELTLKAYGKNVEKLFKVLPGKDPGEIKVKLEGAKGLQVNPSGELQVITEYGPVKFTKPIAYQEIDGKRVEIEVAYQLQETGDRKQKSKTRSQETEDRRQKSELGNPHSAFRNLQSEDLQPETRNPKRFSSTLNPEPSPLNYSFKVGDYDKTFPLIIDPLLASTFVGGEQHLQKGNFLAVDDNGDVFITGRTAASDYPTTPGAYNETFIGGTYDVFVSKLDSDLTTLVASTFLGTGNNDEGRCLALDGSGNVYVTGYQAGFAAYKDMFVAKLDNDLTTLLANTSIVNAEGVSIAHDGLGSVYVTGNTASQAFPTTPGAYDESHNGDGEWDVFVLKLQDNDLSTPLASTFIGGSWRDIPYSLALDADNNVYVTGYTWAGASKPYPTTPGAYDGSLNGNPGASDVFISKLNSDLTNLLASTFIGGGFADEGYSIALDGCSNVYVSGYTQSTDYPITPGAYDDSDNPGHDVFVSKLDNTLSFLFASTYLGGLDEDEGQSLALDRGGNVYITGYTRSSDYPFIAGAYDESHNSAPTRAVFVSKLSSSLSSLFASTYIDGNQDDTANSLFLDGNGNVYVTGYTNSSGYPTTSGAYDQNYSNTQFDVFVSKLDRDLSADPPPGFQSGSFLADPPGVSFIFDADGDGELHVGCNQLMLCDGQIVTVDLWLSDADAIIDGDVTQIDYAFNWIPDRLEVLDVACNNPDWASYTTPDPPVSGTLPLQVSSTGGVPGTTFKLHTITFKVKDVTSPFVTDISATNGEVTPLSGPPVPVTIEGNIGINAICGGDPITCDGGDDCGEIRDICPEPGATETANRYYWEQQGTPLCEGDTISIFHTRKGYYTVSDESFDPTLCDSDCFNFCYENCAYSELQSCWLGCARGCACSHCYNWQEEEVCYEYQNRIACSIKCYQDCNNSYDSGSETASYDHWCGYAISETITVLDDGDGNCTTGNEVDSFTLEGAGTAGIRRSLPLQAGTYDLCAGTALIGTVVVTDCGGSTCRILPASSSLTVDEGGNDTLNVTVESDVDGDYTLSLERRDETQSPLPVPTALQPQGPVSVTGNSGASSVSAINSQVEWGDNRWLNIIVKAEGQSLSCEAAFDYQVVCADVDSDTDGKLDCIDNCPNDANPDQEDWEGDLIGDICDPDDDNDGICDPGESDPSCSGSDTCPFDPDNDSDSDTICGDVDNCPTTSNQGQLDTYPTQGNNIGDACDCEADFNCDGNVDGGDVGDFISDFGRSTYFNPCSNQDPCLGDFNCDVNVDGGDVGIFIEDFGRSTYFNPCPACVPGDWCIYP